MTPPFQPRSVQCWTPSGLHRLAYLEWGRRDNPQVVLCVHGLTRCARDFDALARALASDFRVVCPDLAGRGDSEWLKDPMEYQLPVYLADLVTLIARLDVERVYWVGTSLGGLLGMALAASTDSPVQALVLNDVGPRVAGAALARIASYVGSDPVLSSLEAAEAYLRAVHAPFGLHSDAEWRFLTEHSVRRRADGSLRLHYDPALAVPFMAQPLDKDLELWGLYDGIRCPTLVLRGERSDLLARETALEMSTRGPRARVVELAGVGHAPTLLHDDQIRVVTEFLASARSASLTAPARE
jgi:pimeloyl-ACP methyl ester carboxylesterase